MYTRTALVHQGRTESESEWSWILCSDSAFQSLEWAVIIAKAWGRAHRYHWLLAQMLGFTVAMPVSTLRSDMHIFACCSDCLNKRPENDHGELEKSSATFLPPEWRSSFLLSALLSTSVYLTSPSSHRLVTGLWFLGHSHCLGTLHVV